MAGVGSTCGRVKYSKKSCLSQGRIDVYKNKSEIPPDNSCSYKEGITTGVLCCKRRKSSSSGRYLLIFYMYITVFILVLKRVLAFLNNPKNLDLS